VIQDFRDTKAAHGCLPLKPTITNNPICCEPSKYSVVSTVADIKSIAESMGSDMKERPSKKLVIEVDT
jgi:hypothetical protein